MSGAPMLSESTVTSTRIELDRRNQFHRKGLAKRYDFLVAKAKAWDESHAERQSVLKEHQEKYKENMELWDEAFSREYLDHLL